MEGSYMLVSVLILVVINDKLFTLNYSDMKQLLLTLLCVLFAFSPAFSQDSKNKKETSTFYIAAMDCDHCIKKIEKNIAFEKGVTDLKCDLATRTAIITYKAGKTSEVKLISAFKKIGMEAVVVDKGAGCPVPPSKKSN